MAIDRMKKISIACPRNAASRLCKTLHGLGTVELVDTLDAHGVADDVPLKHHESSTKDCDQQLAKITAILALIDEFVPEQKGFVEGLTPLPMLIEASELDHAVNSFNLDAVHAEANELEEAYKRTLRREAEIRSLVETLLPFEALPFQVTDLTRPKRVRLIYGSVPTPALGSLSANSELGSLAVWETVLFGTASRKDAPSLPPKAARKGHTYLVVACLVADEDTVRRNLGDCGFEEITLPDVHGKVRDRIRELSADLSASEERVAATRARVEELAKYRRSLQTLKAYWDSIRRRSVAAGLCADSRWVHVVTGFTRAADLPKLEQALQHAHPEASLLVEDPAPGEAVPVSITLPPLIRPIRMLIDLFGFPAYDDFDPSPFIIWPFLLFFGICFGDVGYGLMLTALGAYIAYKARAYDSVYNFAKLLLYAGVFTTVCGALLGSWFGDLYAPQYLGEGNPILKLKEKTMLLDPLQEPVVMLVIALFIGVLNQMFGIALKMHGSIKKRDWAGALFDGLLWMVALPGLVLLIAAFMAPLPAIVPKIGAILFLGGAIGLVLTQGREESGIAGRAITGVVSIYGILGSYGCAAFIGDTLSYCRLLALGLTTGIVAMCVNMVADIVRSIPVVGVVLFVVVLVFGHVFNFAISLLGAFVHSMRLILVEMFGRFYSGGTKPFRPMGFDSPEYQMKVLTPKTRG
ncbi:MAG: hypothetical protein K1Y02_03585 [Candidatus Hydrogenedentes bacterium]|nr:hypothetical protein [Candidatus Hydrogenedentota bacterium]